MEGTGILENPALLSRVLPAFEPGLSVDDLVLSRMCSVAFSVKRIKRRPAAERRVILTGTQRPIRRPHTIRSLISIVTIRTVKLTVAKRALRD